MVLGRRPTILGDSQQETAAPWWQASTGSIPAYPTNDVAREGARLHRDYVRLGAARHARLQGADQVVATGRARPAGVAAAPRGEGPRA